MIRIQTLFRAVMVLVAAYVFTLGATWNGLLIPELRFASLALLGIVFAGWMIARLRGRWTWHSTPLDLAFLLWVGAMLLSIVANNESWRRSVIGLWHVGLYIAVWYMLADALANRAFDRDALVDALLFAGLIVLIFGYVQVGSLPLDLTDTALPRPGSVIGNPNALGALLVVLLPLALARLAVVRNRLAQGVLAAYALATLLLLFFTFSRGAWIGTGAALLALIALLLNQHDLLSVPRLRGAWQRLSQQRRQLLTGAAIVMGGLLLLAVVLFVQSLGASGRTLDLRTSIWGPALSMFTEQPLTGQGLFTFGQGLMEHLSMPPRQPHAHAHSAPLHIAAELGLPGLLALAFTLWALVRALRANLKVVTDEQRAAVYGGTAAAVGFAAHHLLDTPMMMPAIALAGLLALVVTAAPLDPQPIRARWRSLGHPVGMVALPVVLLATGFFAAALYADYIRALDHVNDDDYRAAAEALEGVIVADPDMAITYQQQGYLWAVVYLQDDDPQALERAITAYSRFVELESQNAIGWANLAYLYSELGDDAAAILAGEQAAASAPDTWEFWFALALALENASELDRARAAYENALTPASRVSVLWMVTPLAREVAQMVEAEDTGLIVMALRDGSVTNSAEVDALWAASGLAERETSVRTLMLQLFLTMEIEEARNIAGIFQAWLRDASEQATTDLDEAWLHLGRARWARFNGDAVTAQAELDAAFALIYPDDPITADYELASNIGYFQFLRYVIPRQFLPEIGYPVIRDYELEALWWYEASAAG